MVDKKKGQEATPVEPEAKPTPEPVVEGKPEITIGELQQELARLKGDSEKLDANWKSAQRDSSKKELTIQQLREQLSSNESQSDMVKALIAMMAGQKNQPAEEFAEEVKTQQPDLLKQYEQIVKSSEKKRQLDRATNRIRTVQERAEALDIQGEDYDIVRAFAEAGQFEKAEKKLAKLEEAKQTKPPEEKPKETEDERVERLATAKLKAELDKRGLLTQDSGTPSGRGEGWEGVREQFIKNPDDPQNTARYYEMRRAQGR